MGKITFEQLTRGIAAIDRYTALCHAVYNLFTEADEDRIDGLGGSGLCSELLRQLEERCNDPDDGCGGSMLSYMIYEGRRHGGRCVADDGREINVNSPEALWEWWRHTETGPFTPETPTPAAGQESPVGCAAVHRRSGHQCPNNQPREPK